MQLKPFANLSSHHLGPMLFLARFFMSIGVLIIAAAAIVFIIGLFSAGNALTIFPAPILATVGVYNLLLSCVLAAIVAFEENHRKSVVNSGN